MSSALDGNLGELVPLPTGAVVVVIEDAVLRWTRLAGLRLVVPLKMTSLHGLAAQLAGLALPSTQRTASMMLDLPQPLGPTTNGVARQREVGGLGKGFEARV